MEYGKIQILETPEDVEKMKDLESAHEEIEITAAEARKLFRALHEGKSIGWSDGEYTHIIKIK